MDSNDIGFVYLLKNAAMPGLIKIGITYASDVQIRMDQLYTTGVPFRFDLVYAAKVKSVKEVEKALHSAFAPNRLNKQREFFQIEEYQAKGIIKLLEIEDTTEEVEKVIEDSIIDKSEIQAGQNFTNRKKRPNLDFELMGIPKDSILRSAVIPEFALVVSKNKVIFRELEMSLTAATRLALGLENSYSIGPTSYWYFKNRKLSDIYDETFKIEE